MKQLLEKTLNLRKGEFTITLLMFLYYYLLLVTYYFLKPARDSLFLVKLGSNQLPVVFILIALIVAPITTLYAKAGYKLKLNKLINVTTIVMIVCLFILRFLVQLGDSWVYYTFYIWVSIYGVLATSQFWLFANAVYNPSQAKRIFVLITLGGIIGAFTGGEVTSIAVNVLGVSTENLLLFCAGFLFLTIFLLNIIWKMKKSEMPETPVSSRKKEQKKEGMIEVFNIVRKSRHLIFIIGVIAMTMMTASFVDFQFKAVSVDAYTVTVDSDENPGQTTTKVDKSALTAFLGKFYGRLSLVSLFLQLIFAYRFLRILGVGGVILFLPFGLIAGSIAMLAFPGLLAGVLLRGADGSLKYSLDKTGRELLFLPVPLETKKKVKVFIDVFVDRWFRGVAGALLLLFTMVLNFSVQQISIVVIILLIIWIVLALLIKKEYVNAFRQAIEKREINPAELTINIDESETIKTLKDALKGENERQLAYALEMLSAVKNINFTEDIVPVLKHKNSEIRLKAVKILQMHADSNFSENIRGLLNDPEADVRSEALHYLYILAEDNGENLLKEFLEDPDRTISAAAAVCTAEYGRPEHKYLLNKNIVEQLFSGTEESSGEDSKDCNSKIQLAKALGALNSPEYRHYLFNLLDDGEPQVVVNTIKSIGRTKDREFVQSLLKLLADNRYRAEVRNSLANYREKVVGTLSDYLKDSSVDFIIRKNIPGVLCKIPVQESVNILIDSIVLSTPSLKYFIVKALNKLRANYGDLNFDKEKITSVLIEETKSYYQIIQILNAQKSENELPAGKLLNKALEEKLDRNLEQIFRLLGLCYPSKDIYNSYMGIISSKNTIRANAVEFLDNVVGNEIKKYLFPILETDSPDIAIQQGQKLFSFKIKDYDKALETLLACSDPWLKACTVYVLADGRHKEFLPKIKTALSDPDPIVRETAEIAVKKYV